MQTDIGPGQSTRTSSCELDWRRPVQRFSRRDWAIVGLIFLVALALRIPFRAHLAYNWDAAQFVMGVGQYNVALHQPHAPGYILFVVLGKLVTLWLHDAHASLVWVCVTFGSALPAVMYLLGASMFGRRTGLAAALFALTSSTLWFHSCVALTYIADSFLVCLTVLWCWRAMEHGGTWTDAIGVGVCLALTGGIRQQTVPILMPLVLYTLWKFKNQRLGKLIVAGVVAMVLAAAYVTPMVELSGGWPSYLTVVRLQFNAYNAPSSWMGGGFEMLLVNVALVAFYCGYGLMASAIPLLAGLFGRAFRMNAERRRAWNREHDRALWTITWWLAPMFLFATAIGFTNQPGQTLGYLPAFLLLAALAVAQLRSDRAFFTTAVLVSALNALLFFTWPSAQGPSWLALGRSAREIAFHDRELGRMIHVIRSQFNPAKTVVCHAGTSFEYALRVLQIYLPEFELYQMKPIGGMLNPDHKPIVRVHQGQLEFVDSVDYRGKDLIVLVVPPDRTLDMFDPFFNVRKAQPVPESNGTLYTITADGSPLPGRQVSSDGPRQEAVAVPSLDGPRFVYEDAGPW